MKAYSVTEWGGMFAVCTADLLLTKHGNELDGHWHIMRCGIISSCQSAATSETASASGHESDTRKLKQRCKKHLILTLNFSANERHHS